jgi:hypothetical protein
MKILPVGAELFHADSRTDRQVERQTDMTKLTVAFRNFANAPKKYRSYFGICDLDNLWRNKIPGTGGHVDRKSDFRSQGTRLW